MSEVLELLAHVIERTAVTRKPGPMSTGGGFGSTVPIDLDALELRDKLRWASGLRWLELEELALDLIERPHRIPLGACPNCGEQVAVEFDRVAAQCPDPECGIWVSRADAVHAAREYVEQTWLSPAEIEQETRGWGTPVRAGRVRTWRWRGWIEPNEDGRYCLADVLALIDSEAVKARAG
ncbi:hypothetical protein [Amycolatopsis sp. VC5-11]|uniref:hypothetical protein n=1 Tax=Amycolatopsis sp. VC5-11 TaxID=3120156 RepID=UPI00300BD1E6